MIGGIIQALLLRRRGKKTGDNTQGAEFNEEPLKRDPGIGEFFQSEIQRRMNERLAKPGIRELYQAFARRY